MSVYFNDVLPQIFWICGTSVKYGWFDITFSFISEDLKFIVRLSRDHQPVLAVSVPYLLLLID